MSQKIINVGTVANDGTGDQPRTAFQSVNSNFTELYGGAQTSVLGTVFVDAYGAKGDGVTDDTAAIQLAENTRTANQTLKFTPGKTYATATGLLKISTAGGWDISGATLKYTGAGNLRTGSDSKEVGIVNILASGVSIGGIRGTLDGNNKCTTPLAIYHAVSGVYLGPNHLIIANVDRSAPYASPYVWSGISYRVSIDLSGVATTTARASNVSGMLVRPACAFTNASDVFVETNDVTALVLGGSIAEVVGTNAAVSACTGFAWVAGGSQTPGNFNINPQRLGCAGINTGQTLGSLSGAGIGQLLIMDQIIHDIGPTTIEMYSQYLPISQSLVWAAGTIAISTVSTVLLLSITSDVVVTIGAPTSPPATQRAMPLRFVFHNTMGGSLSTPIAFSGAAGGYVSSGTVSPSAGKRITVDFMYDSGSTVWVEVSRSAAV